MKSSVIEMYDPSAHRNHMPDIPAPEPAREVLVITIAKFRLEFLSNAQLEAAPPCGINLGQKCINRHGPNSGIEPAREARSA